MVECIAVGRVSYLVLESMYSSIDVPGCCVRIEESLYDNPEKVERFGGAYLVESIPDGLKIQQRGNDPSHHELMPAKPMTLDEFVRLLGLVKLEEVPK